MGQRRHTLVVGDEWLLCLDDGCTGGWNDDFRNEIGKMILTTRMMMLSVDIITGDC